MTTKHSIEKEKFIDPICGMTVAPETSRGELEFEGKKYYFCSKSCLETFKQKNNIQDSASETVQNENHSSHSHEAMREDKSGSEVDPICGMRVNPQTAAGSFQHE